MWFGLEIWLILGSGGIALAFWSLRALCTVTRYRKTGAVLFACSISLCAQSTQQEKPAPEPPETNQKLLERVVQLESEVSELRTLVKQLQVASRVPAVDGHAAAAVESVQSQAATEQAPATAQPLVSVEDKKTLDFFRDTTINVGIDTYYDYNFNNPIGRVNLLRSYDVLSNNFNLSQASVIFDHPPDVVAGRRWGGRLDLQFGQATDTTQGNPSNEPRPDIYRNIFQAYGTFIVPIGKGLDVDFGKFGSSLGIEGNYTKDQWNYSRSYWFNFLPFYHMGFRTTYAFNDRFALNYWLVNGTNQVEATNGFKDELFGFTAKPLKSVSWTVNYYFGQDHPDRVVVPPTSPIPVQPGLSFEPIIPAPDGRTHIFDTYATWQATPKLAVQGEADYFIQRLWQYSSPGHSSAPSVVAGGAGYARYQFNSKIALAARGEYLSDGGGVFSGLNQDLKEATLTLDYNIANGFLTRYEWRTDFSNQPSFLTNVQGVLSKQQTTATVGLIWWWGRKEGPW
jgi:Putative beta-barrel porin-2, OmpL-like. bbp2